MHRRDIVPECDCGSTSSEEVTEDVYRCLECGELFEGDLFQPHAKRYYKPRRQKFDDEQ